MNRRERRAARSKKAKAAALQPTDVASVAALSERLSAHEILTETDDTVRSVDAAVNAHGYADLMLTTPVKLGSACKRGCSFCCYLPILCTAPEAFAVAARLRSLPAEQLKAATQRLIEREEKARGTMREHVLARVPCAFLQDDGACAVYDVRPLACRGYHSLDRTTCEAAFESGDPDAGIRLNGLARDVSGDIQTGLSLGAGDAGLDGRWVRFMSGVRAALDDTELAARWCDGSRLPDGIVDPSADVADARYGTREEAEVLLDSLVRRHR